MNLILSLLSFLSANSFALLVSNFLKLKTLMADLATLARLNLNIGSILQRSLSKSRI